MQRDFIRYIEHCCSREGQIAAEHIKLNITEGCFVKMLFLLSWVGILGLKSLYRLCDGADGPLPKDEGNGQRKGLAFCYQIHSTYAVTAQQYQVIINTYFSHVVKISQDFLGRRTESFLGFSLWRHIFGMILVKSWWCQ